MRLFVFLDFTQVQGGERGPEHSWGLPHTSQKHVMVLNKKQACMPMELGGWPNQPLFWLECGSLERQAVSSA